MTARELLASLRWLLFALAAGLLVAGFFVLALAAPPAPAVGLLGVGMRLLATLLLALGIALGMAAALATIVGIPGTEIRE